MARLARVVASGLAHHVTQRGNARRAILETDVERVVYLDLLQQNLSLHHVSLLGFCLMSNHVHLVLVPHQADALALALKATHGRYAAYWNTVHNGTGHVWQGRFYSCTLDETHLWEALRYTELNPVRAGMVQSAAGWPWSSAALHCTSSPVESPNAPLQLIQLEQWKLRWTAATWRDYLNAGTSSDTLSTLRQSTHTGRPCGAEHFVRALEEAMQRPLLPQKGGRPLQPPANPKQANFSF